MSERSSIGMLKNQKGFTLVELVLTIIIGGLIFGIAAEVLWQQAESYSFVSKRKITIADVRQTMHKISDEFLHIKDGDVTAITDNSISFVDKSGNSTSFSLGTSGSDLVIFHGSNVLLPSVSAFSLQYIDQNGAALTASAAEIPNIRRIKVTISTQPTGNEGGINLTTVVTPREYIGYTNYQ